MSHVLTHSGQSGCCDKDLLAQYMIYVEGISLFSLFSLLLKTEQQQKKKCKRTAKVYIGVDERMYVQDVHRR